MENFMIKRCQYCNKELLVTDEVHVCDDCGAVYHKTCWTENGGCLTPGCSEQACAKTEPETPIREPADTEMPEQPLFCARCSAPMKQEENFCQRCGAPAGISKAPVFCAQCGAPIGDGERFCQKCGHPVGVSAVVPVPSTEAAAKKKKKKMIIISVIIAAVVLVLAAGGIVAAVLVTNHQREVATQEYIDTATEFKAQILLSGSKLENIGNQMESNWRSYIYNRYSGYTSPRAAVDAALRTKSSDVSAVKANDPVISDLYASLRTVPDEGNKELVEIKEQVEDLYNAYSDFYGCVINISGSYSSYIEDFSKTDATVVKEYKSLDGLLTAYGNK